MTGRLSDRLAAVRERIRLSELVGARVEFDRRRSSPGRGDWWACCPFHQERTPSFHVDDRRGFYYCFGCGAKGDDVAWAREMLGAADFPAALARLEAEAGIAPGAEGRQASRPASRARPAPPPDGRGLARARAIWAESLTDHPVIWEYLAARGVDTRAVRRVCGGLPAAIRCHPDLAYWDRAEGRVVHSGPAMVARIGRHHAGLGVHRTWIARDGRARLGGVKLDKRWLGARGRMFGQPVCLTLHTRRMIVGEGIETTLAVLSHLWGRGEMWSGEAAMSRGALTGAGRPGAPAEPDWSSPAWSPPDFVDELVILAEGSAKDPETARAVTERAKRRHSWRGDGRARACSYRLPGGRWDADRDFADVLAEGAA